MTKDHFMRDNQINWLETCLAGFGGARVTVFGDFCLDAYWLIDAGEEELSVETFLPVRRVKRQKYSLGGAANVAANLAAMGVGHIRAVGLVGQDLFGELTRRMLDEVGVDTSGLLAVQDDWATFVFGKPVIDGVEQNRIDFGGFNSISGGSIDSLAEALAGAAGQSDIVILNQQIPGGVSPPEMIKAVNRVIAEHPQCRFIVDSRHRAELYRGAMIKVNVHEAARISGVPGLPDEKIPAGITRECARKLHFAAGMPVFVTRGEDGIIVCDQAGLHEVPGIQIIERTDAVGAGDTTVAAIAAVLASGGDCMTAARFGNIAASITVRKLFTTGVVTPDEIRQVGPEPDYIFQSELADDPRLAEYVAGTEMEIVQAIPADMRISHAIFDHDGTISTLRQGWEKIMEPMMVRAILGRRYSDADEILYRKVVDAARRLIDRTTGVQTLVQMHHLVDLVRQFGYVPEEEILDMHGYKALYNRELLEMVGRRIEKLRRGELTAEDFQIKGARPMLETLHSAGIRLYLASGTDQADVFAEAEALGYAHLFEGRIFGAVGDMTKEAKRIVIERIIREHNLTGTEFVTFGDGPVEIRETHKRGGVSVGIASDEVRRFGLDPAKRARLIKAGADMIIPDWTQLPAMMIGLGIAVADKFQ